MTLEAYAQSGGLVGAVARLAERAFGVLDEADRAAARVFLLRLAGPGRGDAVTRRRVPLAELAALPDPRVQAVVEPLADARLERGRITDRRRGAGHRRHVSHRPIWHNDQTRA